jgi:hypothetical protein
MNPAAQNLTPKPTNPTPTAYTREEEEGVAKYNKNGKNNQTNFSRTVSKEIWIITTFKVSKLVMI